MNLGTACGPPGTPPPTRPHLLLIKIVQDTLNTTLTHRNRVSTTAVVECASRDGVRSMYVCWTKSELLRACWSAPHMLPCRWFQLPGLDLKLTILSNVMASVLPFS